MNPLRMAVVCVTPFEQNCTLIWDEAINSGVVVDPGGEVERIKAAIDQAGIKVERILITHGHIDHVGAAMALKAHLGVEIIGPHLADKALCDGVEDVARMYELGQGYENLLPDQWLDEGDSVEIGGHKFEVLHCPGHAPGHVVFFSREHRFAHVGDVLFRGSIGRTDLPGGDHAALIASIKNKLLPLGDDVTFICGHGPGGTLGEERISNPFLV